MAGTVTLSRTTFDRIMRSVSRVERMPAHGPRDRTRQPVGGGGGGGGVGKAVIVVGHGTPYVSAAPDPDPPGVEIGRIYSHIGRAIQGTLVNGLAYGLADVEFYSAQPGGWFHPGQIVHLFNSNTAACPGFFGKVIQSQQVAAPWGEVAVAPFDGHIGNVYANPASITIYDDPATVGTGVVQRAASFIGTHLLPGEPVFCVPSSGLDAGGIPAVYTPGWLAFNMPNLFGHPSDIDYANQEPSGTLLCGLTDPDIPVPPPIDDVLADLPDIGEAGA